jgi:hypothetical protein
MLEIILLTNLLATAPAPAPVATPVDDCVKTRTCAAASDYEICVWPRKCAPKAAEAVAQFQPCVWPNRCSGRRQDEPLI